MNNNKIEVKIIDLEDEKGFYDLLAEVQVKAVLSMCPEELKIPVLEKALELLKNGLFM